MTLELRTVLDQVVHAGGVNRPFGELTSSDVVHHAAALREAVGWGPTARVASFARAWSELARQMEEVGAATVADLDPDALVALVPSLWVVHADR
jgi:hypothetical protein